MTSLTLACISTVGRPCSFRVSELSIAFAGSNGGVLYLYGKLMNLTLETHKGVQATATQKSLQPQIMS